MVPVFDGHNDALTRPDHARLTTGRDGGHLDLPRMMVGGLRGGIFSVFTESPGATTEPVDRDDNVIEFPYAPAVEHASAAAHASEVAGRLVALEREGFLRLARTIEDVDRALKGEGPPVGVLHLEGAEAIDTGLEALDFWYAAGLRSLGPVWSRANDFAYGVPFISPSSPDVGPGLSPAGCALVTRCAELGILVDLSHLNEAGFWDVERLAVGPLVASHSAAHALCPSSRNLTDRQLDAIGASRGLVGIVFSCPFLRQDFARDENTPLELIVQHARYVADRIGVAHVALGSDFDGTTIPRELGDVAGLPRLLDAFSAAGFSNEEIQAIAWKNWRQTLASWWNVTETPDQ
ncbi:MAG TPA: dipeptidase [Solirubrobacteraceae bacterium]|jgi:membrane dipeptidase|nr:dipeptidase [Solirubrobacteraceae bacterium]